jgi:hypothetical protein
MFARSRRIGSKVIVDGNADAAKWITNRSHGEHDGDHDVRQSWEKRLETADVRLSWEKVRSRIRSHSANISKPQCKDKAGAAAASAASNPVSANDIASTSTPRPNREPQSYEQFISTILVATELAEDLYLEPADIVDLSIGDLNFLFANTNSNPTSNDNVNESNPLFTIPHLIKLKAFLRNRDIDKSTNDKGKQTALVEETTEDHCQGGEEKHMEESDQQSDQQRHAAAIQANANGTSLITSNTSDTAGLNSNTVTSGKSNANSKHEGVWRAPGLHSSSLFLGKTLCQDPTTRGNQRLTMWYEVTLLMSTLLLSIALPFALETPSECGFSNNNSTISTSDSSDTNSISSSFYHDTTNNSCDLLLQLDHSLWIILSLILVTSSATMWVSHWIVTHLSEKEVVSFVSNHVRLTSWGVLITFGGLILFPFAIVARIFVVSPVTGSDIIRHVAIIVAASAVLLVQVFSFSMVQVLGAEIGFTEYMWIMMGSFGLLPGTNRLRKIEEGGCSVKCENVFKFSGCSQMIAKISKRCKFRGCGNTSQEKGRKRKKPTREKNIDESAI